MVTCQENCITIDGFLTVVTNLLAVVKGQSEVVIVFSTVILAIFTIVLAFFTILLWKESKKTRILQQTPQISIAIERIVDEVILSIKNSSSRDAKDVSIKLRSK